LGQGHVHVCVCGCIWPDGQCLCVCGCIWLRKMSLLTAPMAPLAD